MKNYCKKTLSGFTLIELVIVIVLTGIIGAIATKMLAQGLNAYLTSKNVADADWQGRLALERMTRDIRAVRSPTDIALATSSQFTFTDSNGSSVAYTLSGSNLMRNSQALANGISTLTFQYYDETGVITAITTAIRYISITLNVTQGNSNMSFTTSVYPRNLP